jgi:hypothetical protein
LPSSTPSTLRQASPPWLHLPPSCWSNPM